jgi:hypothetical protein
MQHSLIEQYPTLFSPLKDFTAKHPDLMPMRRARACIANLENQDDDVKLIFRKRFGRWYIHVPSLIAYMEREESIISAA